jgi:adenosylcobinamide kinase / adenosylcobinamide-phosphate guanylyltransferase
MDGNRIALIGGGVRSGKSAYAVQLANDLGERRVFVATATPSDEEMKGRIERHREDRRGAFSTVEAPLHLAEAIDTIEGCDVVVIDCLTMWLSNLLLNREPIEAILARVDRLVVVLRERRFHAVVVTNEVGMSVHPPTPLGRAFVEVCGWAHQRIARACDEIYLAVLGTIVRVRPASAALVPAARTDA